MVKVINGYTLIDVIGQGSYGSVYRALNSKKIGEFAVKIIPIEKFQENDLLEGCTLNQVKTLSSIGACEFIVKYEEHFQTKNNYYFVYEYCNGGTLLEAIKRQGPFQQKKSLAIFRQLLEAFKILNRFNIMHRDIKPENIFFSNGKVKLGDFGFCKGLQPGQSMAKTMLGSPIYMAPEVLRGETYTTKADIWSLGVVLYEMLFGFCPFQSKSIAMLIGTISSTDIVFSHEINTITERTEMLMKKMLTKDYFRRVSWIELFGCYKIDEEGGYIEGDNTPGSPFAGSNKSFSMVRDEHQKGETKLSIIDIARKPASLPKEPARMKFYSEKYMNAVTQPIINKGTEKKIPKDYAFDKVKEDCTFERRTSLEKRQNEQQTSFNRIKEKDRSKRQKILKKHQECLTQLTGALKLLQKRQVEYISESFLALYRVHEKLRQITEDIKISETELLDIASIINYEIIQIDRQIIETKQELVRRKLDVPQRDRHSSKSIDSLSGFSIPDIKAFILNSTDITLE